MLNRLFPLFIVFCIFALAIFTYLSWRTAEREETANPPEAGSRHAQVSEQLKQAEVFALRAEAAAARAQVALEKIEALVGPKAAPAEAPAAAPAAVEAVAPAAAVQ